ncbi:MAG: GPR1/FUN34/YaaH family transporter [Firmicutes bacterium]|nr:GPR1/FUN34/YaaH family transporter [Bacillota bacterium]
MSGNGQGWANPAPAGLVALGVACFTFYYLLTCPKAAAVLPLLACWLLGGFVVQIIVGVVELMEGATTGGNVFTVFAAFFMLTGAAEFMVKYFAAANKWAIPLDTKIDGWAWTALAIFIVGYTPAYFKATSVLTLAVISLDVAVVTIAMMDLGILAKTTGNPIAAYGLLLTGILGLYLSIAMVTNTAFGKSVLPIPAPWSK